jgi:hypothetical protein
LACGTSTLSLSTFTALEGGSRELEANIRRIFSKEEYGSSLSTVLAELNIYRDAVQSVQKKKSCQTKGIPYPLHAGADGSGMKLELR